MKVMVIPEDPTLDRYILKPLVEQLFVELGRQARIEVLENPRLRGVAQALDGATLDGIIATYRMIDLFLVLVDRDGDTEARPRQAATREQEHPDRLFACLAIEEVEVWMLALHRGALDTSWPEVRSERDPKERYAQPFLAQHAPPVSLGQGRAWAMRDVGAKWRGLVAVCPELGALQTKVADWLSRRT